MEKRTHLVERRFVNGEEDEIENEDAADEEAAEEAAEEVEEADEDGGDDEEDEVDVTEDGGSKPEDEDLSDVKLNASPDAETTILFTNPAGMSNLGEYRYFILYEQYSIVRKKTSVQVLLPH